MSVNDTSRIIIDDSRVMLQIVASHIDDSRGISYDFNMFIVQATDVYAKLSNLKPRQQWQPLYLASKRGWFL